mmetsp:Transcript_71651/g.213847  ORF Transcript_71651/g.213847 Transcript_71651/m.213847 type:complete len:210 (+) Transcript_71651:158-787(+)
MGSRRHRERAHVGSRWPPRAWHRCCCCCNASTPASRPSPPGSRHHQPGPSRCDRWKRGGRPQHHGLRAVRGAWTGLADREVFPEMRGCRRALLWQRGRLQGERGAQGCLGRLPGYEGLPLLRAGEALRLEEARDGLLHGLQLLGPEGRHCQASTGGRVPSLRSARACAAEGGAPALPCTVIGRSRCTGSAQPLIAQALRLHLGTPPLGN